MNQQTLELEINNFKEIGLYSGKYSNLEVSIHKHIEYANNLLIAEVDSCLDTDTFVAYTLLEECSSFFYWTDELQSDFLKSFDVSEIELDKFINFFNQYINHNSIAKIVDLRNLKRVYQLFEPSFEDFEAAFVVESNEKKFLVYWDFTD